MLLREFLETGCVLVAATSHRGKGSPNFIDHGRKLSPDHLAALDKFMLENSANMNLRRATKFMNDTFPNFSFKKARSPEAVAWPSSSPTGLRTRRAGWTSARVTSTPLTRTRARRQLWHCSPNFHYLIKIKHSDVSSLRVRFD